MSEHKHTPGPWATREGFSDDTIEIYQKEATFEWPCRPNELAIVEAEDAEGRANARLIAAAPELLEALQDMMSDHQQLNVATLEFARAAIAKATGKEGA